MKILENRSELEDFLKEIQKKTKKIGLIPTLGGIHEGHLSLIQACKQLGYFSLVTIFVNPTQFNDIKDFNKYPRDHDRDKEHLKDIGSDSLFLPSSKDLYPSGIKSEKTIFQYRDILCDIYRPHHFDGVTTVVQSLFNLINPDHVFFGEKDFQQLKIIEKLIEKNNLPIVMQACPSIRMSNGMSYSSRYKNFSLIEEKIFNNIAKLLIKYVEDLRKNLNIKTVKDLENKLLSNGVEKIDYLEIRNENNLLLTSSKNSSRLFIAFYLGKIRIIDNFILY